MPNKDDLSHLRGEIVGPPDTPFAGARFVLTIEIPDSYPFTPPVVKFATRIWHPNISSQTGVICLDILKDQWAASMTLRTVLLSIQALLTAAEPDDPQDGVVARQYKENRDAYDKTAAHWAQAYAGAQPSGESAAYNAMLQEICAMGFDEATARDNLSACDWDQQRAVERLLR